MLDGTLFGFGAAKAAQSPGTCSMFVCSKSPIAIALAWTEHHAAAQSRSYDTVELSASTVRKDMFKLVQGKWLGKAIVEAGRKRPGFVGL